MKKESRYASTYRPETARLASRIRQDYYSAISDHNQRMVKNRSSCAGGARKPTCRPWGGAPLEFPLPYIR